MSVYCEFFFSTVLYPPAQVWRINIPPRVGKYLTRLLDQSFTEIGLANMWKECFILEFDCVSSLTLYLPLSLAHFATAHVHTATLPFTMGAGKSAKYLQFYWLSNNILYILIVYIYKYVYIVPYRLFTFHYNAYCYLRLFYLLRL